MKCGLGNWTDISEQYLKGAKTPKECETHYFTVLMQQTETVGYQNVLIERKDESELDESVLKDVQKKVEDYLSMKKREKEAEDLEFGVNSQAQSHLQVPGNYMEQPNPNVASAPNIPNSKQNLQQQMSSQTHAANQLAKQNCHEVLGYLPKRGDFEQEYDMDAELLLADMEFFDDDTPENIELKNSVIELYNGRLDERIRRKKFVIERGLLNLK